MRFFIQFIPRFLFLVLLSGFIATCSSSTGGTSEYTLSTNVTPSNAGSVNPSSGTYQDGTSISIKATPNDGWEFSKWSGNSTSSNNPLTLVMDANKSITANFIETSTEYSLSTQVSPSGAGSINPSSGSYEEGTSVSVQASANEGWEFTEWSGDANSSDNPLSLSMNSNKNITANFVETGSEYTVIFTVEDSTDALELQMGQQQDATNGFDEGIDQEAPPEPPEGALHAYLQNADVNLFKDFRSSNTNDINWDIQFQPGTGDSLRFHWSLEITELPGSLILENPDGTIQIDMQSDQELNIPSSQEDNLIIRYSRDSE